MNISFEILIARKWMNLYTKSMMNELLLKNEKMIEQ